MDLRAPRAWSARGKIATAICAISALAALSAIAAHAPAPRSPAAYAAQVVTPMRREPIQPIAPAPPLDAVGRARAALGARLFSDPRLSEDSSLACDGCHDLSGGGADRLRVSVGVHGRLGVINAPTVFNVDLNSRQFWDGRATSLESQVDGPLQSQLAMASTWPEVVRKLSGDPGYRAAFDSAYPGEGITPSSVRAAIASFERTLQTTGSRFDRFLLGDPAAISELEHTGYDVFKSRGCISCHQGRNVGGNVFEKLGVMGDYFADRGGALLESDMGRFNATRLERDRFWFRVPSLRMAALTAPYFHDGFAQSLPEAVVLMGRYQLGEELPPADVTAIVAFLGTLAGTCDVGAVHANR